MTSDRAYSSLTMWALAIRDAARTSPASVALSRAVTPELAALALRVPSLRHRLETIPATQHLAAVHTLGVLTRTRRLRHDHRVSLGEAFRHLSDSTIDTLALAAASSQPNACRMLGNAIAQVASRTPVNLVEFVTLLTSWETLDLRARSEFLVDLHSARRA